MILAGTGRHGCKSDHAAPFCRERHSRRQYVSPTQQQSNDLISNANNLTSQDLPTANRYHIRNNPTTSSAIQSLAFQTKQQSNDLTSQTCLPKPPSRRPPAYRNRQVAVRRRAVRFQSGWCWLRVRGTRSFLFMDTHCIRRTPLDPMHI